MRRFEQDVIEREGLADLHGAASLYGDGTPLYTPCGTGKHIRGFRGSDAVPAAFEPEESGPAPTGRATFQGP